MAHYINAHTILGKCNLNTEINFELCILNKILYNFVTFYTLQ